MKAYKLELLIIDMDDIGEKEVISIIENQTYPNRCISPKVINIDTADIGEWTDEHPLNNKLTCIQYYRNIFQ